MNQIHELIVLILNLSQFLKKLIFPFPLSLQQHGHFLTAATPLNHELIIMMP